MKYLKRINEGVRYDMRVQGLPVEGGIAGGYYERPKNVILENEEEAVIELKLYHGTPKEFDNFDIKYFNRGSGDGGWLGKGFYFTNNYDYAKSYGNVITANITLNKPYILTDSSYSRSPNKLAKELGVNNSGDVRFKLMKEGYDSVMLKYDDNSEEGGIFTEVCVFEPESIKIISKEDNNLDESIKMLESFKSQKELEMLATDILIKCGDETYRRAVEYKKYIKDKEESKDNYVFEFSSVYLKDIKKTKYDELLKFMNIPLYIQFDKENEYTTHKGGYGGNSIYITYSQSLFNKINEEFNEGKIKNGNDIYFSLHYETHSTLLHELQHAYDDWRSGGKALYQSPDFNYNVIKRKNLVRKQNRGIKLSEKEIDFLLKHNDDYFHLPHEINARFTQAVKELRPMKLDHINKIWYIGVPWETYVSDFKLYFPGWKKLSDENKKRILKKLGQFYELEKEYVKEKTKKLQKTKD